MNGTRFTLTVLYGSLALFFPYVARAQIMEEIETGHTCSYFGETVPDKVTSFSSDQQAEDTIQQIVDASGLAKNFEVRAAGVPNAAAVIGPDGKRYILYNQYFMRDTKSRTNNEWAPVSIMAHEVGHHLNGHTLDGLGSRPPSELQADYYSGFILQRMGADLDDARAAMDIIGSDSGSHTHPPKHDRLAAITRGWTKACEADQRCSETQPGTVPDNTEAEHLPRQEDQRNIPQPAPLPVNSDSCIFARDGTCEEPYLCPPGTDTTDCRLSSTPAPSPRSRNVQRAQIIQCHSKNHQYRHCPANTRGGLPLLVKKRSKAACIFGQTWGYDAFGIWVNNGCGAEFHISPLSAQPTPKFPLPSQVGQPRHRLYCCDQQGGKWCEITPPTAPPGVSCYCAGVRGTGITCY